MNISASYITSRPNAFVREVILESIGLEIYCTILSAFVDSVPDLDAIQIIYLLTYLLLEIQIMAMDESYLKSLSAFRERGNYREMFVNALSKICTDVKLGGVRSCLAIGPGDGWYEIEFIKHCEANISKFIGIEPDHASAEHLRTALRSSLPGVESQVFETTMENWESPGKPVDLIIMFQVLHYIPTGERQEFLKKIHDSRLVSGGWLAFVMSIPTKSPMHSADIVFERLGLQQTRWEKTEADFLKAGFTKQYEHEMHVKKDLTDPDENLLLFYQLHFKNRVITLDDLREAMKWPISEGKVDELHVMVIFKSTN